MKDEKRERGRPTKYDKDFHDNKAFDLYVRGFTNALVAKKFGISARTLDYWIQNHETFRDKVEEGREASNSKLEWKLYRMANGYYKTVYKPFVVKGKIEYAEYQEYIQPSYPAIKFLMVNRMPKLYRDKVEETETEETSKPVAINIKVVKNDD